jgi:PRC-barrel domain
MEDPMSLPTIDQARSWRGLTLVATDDEPVGKIEAIYVDRSTKQPEWALVHTGLFGSSRTLVPLADAAQRGDTVRIPHETSVIREAPRLEQDAELSEEDETRLYAHYGIQYTTNQSSSGLPAGETGSATAGTDATTELPPHATRLEADVPAAGTVPGMGQTATRPAAGTSWSEGTTGADGAGSKGGRGGQAAVAGGLSGAGSTRAARTAVQAGQQAAASGRMAVHKASQEVAAVVAAIETTPESKRKARKRTRARKRAMAAAAGAARSVAAALAAAWRRVRKSDAG